MTTTLWVTLTIVLFACGMSFGAVASYATYRYGLFLGIDRGTGQEHDRTIAMFAGILDDQYAWDVHAERYEKKREQQRQQTDPRLIMRDYSTFFAGAYPVPLPDTPDTPPWELPDEAAANPNQRDQRDQATMPIAARTAPTTPFSRDARRVWSRPVPGDLHVAQRAQAAQGAQGSSQGNSHAHKGGGV